MKRGENIYRPLAKELNNSELLENNYDRRIVK
jgi:hypothetical protein